MFLFVVTLWSVYERSIDQLFSDIDKRCVYKTDHVVCINVLVKRCVLDVSIVSGVIACLAYIGMLRLYSSF